MCCSLLYFVFLHDFSTLVSTCFGGDDILFLLFVFNFMEAILT